MSTTSVKIHGTKLSKRVKQNISINHATAKQTKNSTANQSFQSTMPSMGQSSFDQCTCECFSQPKRFNQPKRDRLLAQFVSWLQLMLWQLGYFYSDKQTTGRTSTKRTSRWREHTPRPSHGVVQRIDRGPDHHPIKRRKAFSIWTQSHAKTTKLTIRLPLKTLS